MTWVLVPQAAVVAVCAWLAYRAGVRHGLRDVDMLADRRAAALVCIMLDGDGE